MPAYFVVLAIYFLLPAWREYPEMSQPLWKFLLSVQNIALHGGTAFSHAWSLAVEDQFYLALPFLLLFLYRRPRAAILVACLIVVGGIALRAFLAAQNPSVDGGVSFRGFQAWICYPTWTRLDPLVFGVVLAAIERFRPNWWQRLINCAPWLWLSGFGLIVYALYLGETKNLTIAACVGNSHSSPSGWPHFLFARSVHDSHSVELQFPARLHRQNRLQRLLDSETRH